MGLVGQPEHDDPGETGRRIGEYVGKIQVQRDEHAALTAADVYDSLIRRATQILLDH